MSTRSPAEGPLRVFELLHDARPLLLNLGQPEPAAAKWPRLACAAAQASSSSSGPSLRTLFTNALADCTVIRSLEIGVKQPRYVV